MKLPRFWGLCRPKAIVEAGLLLVLPLLFSRQFAEQFSDPKRFLTEVLVLTAAGAWAVGVIWGKAAAPRNSSLTLPLALLGCAVLVSCLNSPLPTLSLVEAEYFLCGPIWLLLLVAWGGGEARLRWLAALVSVASAAVAIIALAQWARHDPLQFGGYHVEWGTLRSAMRLYSTFGNPNFVAGYLIGAIFLALALTASSKSSAARVLSGIAVLVTFAAIIGTRSRGAWVGLAAGLLVARRFWKAHGGEGAPVPEGGLSTGGAALGVWILPATLVIVVPSLTQQVRALLIQLEARAYLWRAAWPMFTAHPLFGSGWGTFQLRFPELQARFLGAHPELSRYWTFTRQLHSDPLQILLEAGAVAFVALGWLLWRYGRELRQAAPSGTHSTRLWLGASAGGAAAILVDSLFNFQLAVPPTLILLFTLLALPRLLQRGDDEGVSPPRGLSCSRGIIALLSLASVSVFAAVALLAFGIVRRTAAERDYGDGLAEERRGDVVRAGESYRRGLERAPGYGELHYGLARTLYLQQQYPEALAETLQAERTLADPHLEVLKARIEDQMDFRSPALEAYRHALWLDPKLKTVHDDIERLSK
ncbi:MAG: O-antigen ligase family protein [Acidobacteriia bacterium]|nr:O-antigen ligase family protein [Terriglobia bacterium]